MASLRDIKRRIKSVKNTQQITKAMKMVSAAKLRRAQEDIQAARPYADKMSDVIASLAGKVPPESHPLFSSVPTGKTELIVVTSDRGLCGSFNGALLRAADRFIAQNKDKKITMTLVGRRGMDYFKRRGATASSQSVLGNKRPTYNFAVKLAQGIIQAYRAENGVEDVYLVYSEFKSALVQSPVVKKILPMTPPEASGREDQKELLFEPSPEGVLDSLFPRYVEVQLFRALLESSASEHGARMTAMDSASSNAASMIESLTLKYNRARQAAITKELMEIIGGAEALK